MYAYSRAAAASLGGPWAPARPSRAAGDRPAARCGVRAGRPADDSQKLAVTLIRGVAAVPAGRQRAEECAKRRDEIAVGIDLVLHTLESTEKALRAPAVRKADSDGEPSPELSRHLKSLRWAANFTNAMQTAARTLKTLDSFDTPELEYSEIAEQLCIIKETLRDFTGMMLDAGSAAVLRPDQAAKPAAHAPLADKHDALSETCSTASGLRSSCASEVSSEADCDSPRFCGSSKLAAQAFAEDCGEAPAPDDESSRECGGGPHGRRPCGAWSGSWYTTPLYWG